MTDPLTLSVVGGFLGVGVLGLVFEIAFRYVADTLLGSRGVGVVDE